MTETTATEAHEVDRTFKIPFEALREALLPLEAFTEVDPDYAPYSDALHACFVQLDPENHDYLSDIGMFTYSLVTTAKTNCEREHLTKFCTLLLAHLVNFHISENQIEFED
ncbi:hypothetical protein IB265_33105 [Ensifer sp. ENS10]|uniref:hypothetical protein n=1 Tax=Ensifer sp. ENS10 TaxID=2769286 RepID=UPI00177B01D5|nr:hypothetical protein [Ensifer sp. ENS10]MBD9511597.1 hypothetical protein [Ensifer sp. ENS10]